MFAAKGFHGFSMRELAEQVGITHSGLLHHYPTKQHLLRAALNERQRRSMRGLTDLRDIEPSRMIMVNAAAEPQLARFYVTLAGEAVDPGHPAHAHFAQNYQRTRRSFTQGFEIAKRVGDLNTSQSSHLLAKWLITLMDGLQLQWLYDDSMDLVAAYDRALLSLAPMFGASERVVNKLQRLAAETSSRREPAGGAESRPASR